MVVVGAGLSGLACALAAVRCGFEVSVLERADKVGGAAAYSGGQVWVAGNHVARQLGISDSVEAGEAYVRAISGDPSLLDEAAMQRWLKMAPPAIKYWEEIGAIEWELIPGFPDYHQGAAGARDDGRYLTGRRFDGKRLGRWREHLRVSPHFPKGATYEEIFAAGRWRPVTTSAAAGDDPLTFGTGIVAAFLARALDEPGIEILLERRVTELLYEADRVVGVRADGPAGTTERRGHVVLATSSYDWDPRLVQEYLTLGPDDFGSAAPTSISGDGIRLASAVGGDVAQIPAQHVPLLPGWPVANEPGYKYGPEYALPHAFTVDDRGRRFCDDSYYIDIVRRALDPADRHIPCFMIWDERHHQRYGLAGTPPGHEYPPGLVESADSLPALADKLGIPGDALHATAERFNLYADAGEDPDWGRGTNGFVRMYTGDPQHEPNPLLGSVAHAPFFGTRLRLLGTGIGSTGIRTNLDGQVLTAAREPIAGLYAIGACAAMLTSGSGYNSGFALARGLTMALVVARHAEKIRHDGGAARPEAFLGSERS